MTARRIVWIALVISLLLAATAFPASAPARRGLMTGLSGDDQYQASPGASPSPPSPGLAPAEIRDLWFDRTVDAGAGIVRLSIHWDGYAPTPPADPTDPASYNFLVLDRAVRDAAERGLKVLINVNTAPAWAEGPGRPGSVAAGAWRPNPLAFAQFMQMLAGRYTGSFAPALPGAAPLPFVQAVQIWNEPNHERWLAPQFQGREFVGAEQYRELLDASYDAIKAVNPRMLVVTGGTGPYGDPLRDSYTPGGTSARPVKWWEKLLCLRAAKAKSRKKGTKSKQVRYARSAGCDGTPLFDVFAHQAIDNTGKGPLQSGPSRYDASTPDLGRVVKVLRAAERLGTVPGGRHPVWVTEFWWDSNPPNPAGAPLLTQARWIEQSLYLYWKAGADTAINFRIQDSTLNPSTRNGLQSGLYFLDGSPKPALTAFRFPFVTERLNQRTLRAWGKAPEAGKLRIQRRQSSRWKTVKKLGVSEGQVFLTRLRLSGKRRLRATVGSSTSIVWTQPALRRPPG